MIKVGDLICYNVGGQKYKSLGLVLDCCVRTDNGKIAGVDRFYYIFWIRKPQLEPRREWSDPRAKFNAHWSLDSISDKNPDKGWYKDGNWFEKVKTGQKMSSTK